MSAPAAPTAPTAAVTTQKKPRCEAEGCRTRLTLTDFACKCQKTFCSKHRPCEEHACGFDFRAAARQELLKTMSTPIIAAKVEVI
jgi:predicted nucleic acid binding AN1-type Zn finger protein